MNPSAAEIELALEKQRLQFRCAAQRNDLMGRLTAIEGALGTLDRGHAALLWMRDNAPLLSGLLLALALLKPRLTLRWLRRGVFAWQLIRRNTALRGLIARLLAARG